MATQQFDSREARVPAHDGAEAAKTNVKSIVSLICGLLFLFFPAAVVAVVLGHLSRADIRRSGGKLKGAKMALAGLILGYVGVVAMPLLLVMAIAIPSLVHARAAADEASVRGALKTLSTAVTIYEASYGKLPPDLRSLGPETPGKNPDSTAAGLIDAELAQGVKSGYKFTYHVNADSSDFKIEAAPLVPGKTGLRYMWIDRSGEVQFSNTPDSL